MAILTAKQERFCMEWVVDCNATQAAIRAGYSQKTACKQASRLLANAKIKEYIQNLMSEKDTDLIATQDEVLQTLTRTLRREEKEYIVVTLKSRKSYTDENGKRVTEEQETAEAFEIPARLSDVNKAAELLGKRYRLFTDKIDIDGGNLTVVVNHDYGDN